MKRWLAPILTSCLVLTALPALADDDGDDWGSSLESTTPMGNPCMAPAGTPPGTKGPGAMGRGMEGLNLTAEQQTQMTALRDQFAKNRAADREQMRQAMDKVHALVKDPNASASAIEAAVQAKHTLMVQAELAHIAHWREMRKILTPEQVQQLDSRREHRRDRMMEGDEPLRRR